MERNSELPNHFRLLISFLHENYLLILAAQTVKGATASPRIPPFSSSSFPSFMIVTV